MVGLNFDHGPRKLSVVADAGQLRERRQRTRLHECSGEVAGFD